VPPTLADRVRHVLEAIRQIQAALSGVEYTQFEGDLLLRLAVERLLEIVSEASNTFRPTSRQPSPTFLGGRSRTSTIACATRITPSTLRLCGRSQMKMLSH
jgi:hypothetical protein